MFNLDLAVHQWCAQVLRSYSIKNRKIDELKDHLYCLIEKHEANGLNEQEAFERAIEEIGSQDELKAQFDQNLSLLNKLCTFEFGSIADTTHQGETIMKLHKNTQITQAVLWATAMLASALVLRGTEQAHTVTMLIILPLALVSIFATRKQFISKRNQLDN